MSRLTARQPDQGRLRFFFLVGMTLFGLFGCAEDADLGEPAHAASPAASNETPPADNSSPAGNAAVSGNRHADALPERSEKQSDGPLSSEPVTVQHHRLPVVPLSIDNGALAAAGIHAYESTHLLLLSDLPADDVRHLPALADALFEELQQRTGPLLPASDGRPFQVTGCLIDAEERFRAAGLLPPEGFTVRHGRHLGYRFWMYNPTTDYYRRHLMLHEFVHCFMMCEHGMNNIPPLWYTEGIAEYFATHDDVPAAANLIDGNQIRFAILPSETGSLDGWGRISEIRRNFETRPSSKVEPSQIAALDAVLSPQNQAFVEDINYAYAWTLCWLIRTHPIFQREFESLFEVREGAEFVRRFRAIPKSALDQLRSEWPLFVDSLTEGFDIRRSFPESTPEVRDGVLQLNSERDWQFTGMTLDAGQAIQLHCSGRCQVHSEPKPWISEPQGITIEYHRGRPLGEVVAMLVADDGSWSSRRIPVGREAKITTPVAAALWLQVNDSSARRAENSGSYQVSFSSDR